MTGIITALRAANTAEGGRAGFEMLMDAYGGYIAAILRRIAYMASEEDIEECAADCLVRIWKNAHLLEDATLKSYVGAVARNRAIDLRRQCTRSAFLPLNEDVLFAEGGPESEAERNERAQAVRAAVAAFSPPDGEIFLRRYWLGEPLAAIAEALGLSERAVEGRLRRGRKKLRDTLGGYDEQAQ